MKKIFIPFIIIAISSLLLIGCTIINNTGSDEKTDNVIQTPTNDKPSEESQPPNTSTQNPTPDKEHASKKVNCRLFFFDSEKLELYYIDKDLTVEDNALITALTKELQNTNTSDSFLKLTDKVGIKSANLNKDNGILTVVFNKSYVDEMILGSATESGLLSSLINTYGYNYGVDKVAIYFGDKLYTSLKGDLPEGYFKTNFSEGKPYDTNTSTPIVKEKNCRLFFYNAIDDCIYYEDSILDVTDNTLTTALTTALKYPSNSNLLSIPKNVSVISATLDKPNDILTVNLSKNYYDILSKVGSGPEGSLLNSLAMTYGYNYNVSKVIILIDSKPYSGSHISLSDGETINFDLSTAKPLN